MNKLTCIAIVLIGTITGTVLTFKVRNEPTFRGKATLVWFREVKLGQNSEGLSALCKMGGSAVPMLCKQLKSLDSKNRAKAAWVLGELGPIARNSIPDIMHATDDDYLGVQLYAIHALALIDASNLKAMSKIRAKLRDPRLAISSSAADALDLIENDQETKQVKVSTSQYDYAISFLNASAPDVRLRGLNKLIKVADRNDKVLAGFKIILEDANPWVRQQAQIVLESNGVIKVKQHIPAEVFKPSVILDSGTIYN